jgi:hypothetical protein
MRRCQIGIPWDSELTILSTPLSRGQSVSFYPKRSDVHDTEPVKLTAKHLLSRTDPYANEGDWSGYGGR